VVGIANNGIYGFEMRTVPRIGWGRQSGLSTLVNEADLEALVNEALFPQFSLPLALRTIVHAFSKKEASIT
jgi:hypothetical protein